jgi:hypothetical protein
MPYGAPGNAIVIGALLQGDERGKIAESLMSTPPFGHENQPQFHSEFGYFCPTPQLRRVVRVACLGSAIGGVVGAIAVWVVMSAGDTDHSRTATFMDATAAVATTGQAHRPDAPATTAIANDAAAVTDKAAADCQAQAWPYRTAKCGTQSNTAREVDKPIRVLRPDQLKQSGTAIVLTAPTAKEAAKAAVKAASAKADEGTKATKQSRAKAHKRTKRSYRHEYRHEYRHARSRDGFDERAYDSPYRRRYQARQWNDDWGWGW